MEARVAALEARVAALEAAQHAMIEHMQRCPERGGPLSWRCLGVERLVGHGKRCTEGHRL